jgi:hypothetical protein
MGKRKASCFKRKRKTPNGCLVSEVADRDWRGPNSRGWSSIESILQGKRTMNMKVLLAFAVVAALANTVLATPTTYTVANFNFAAPTEASGAIGSKTAITGWTAESVPSGKLCGVWNPTTASFGRDGAGFLAGTDDSAACTQCLYVGTSNYASEVYQRANGGGINIAANTYYTMVVSVGAPLASDTTHPYVYYGIELWGLKGSSQNTIAQNWGGKPDGIENAPNPNPVPMTPGSFTDVITQFSTIAGSTGKNGQAVGTKYNGQTLAYQLSGEGCAYTNVRVYSSTTGFYYPPTVPEPGSAVLLGMGAISGLCAYRWRRRRRAN